MVILVITTYRGPGARAWALPLLRAGVGLFSSIPTFGAFLRAYSRKPLPSWLCMMGIWGRRSTRNWFGRRDSMLLCEQALRASSSRVKRWATPIGFILFLFVPLLLDLKMSGKLFERVFEWVVLEFWHFRWVDFSLRRDFGRVNRTFLLWSPRAFTAGARILLFPSSAGSGRTGAVTAVPLFKSYVSPF